MKILNIKISTLVFISLLMFSCDSQKDEQAIKQEIDKLKTEIKSIQNEINILSEQIIETDAVNTSSLIPVEVKILELEPFNHFFIANGSVEAVNDAIISPQMSGQINRIHVKEGQRVKKGKLLISLDTQIIDGTIDELKNGLELAKKIYNKQKSLWDQNIGSEIQFLEVKNSKESLEKKLKTLNAQKELALIRAPFSGVIDEIFVKKGELAVPGYKVLQLVNLNNLIVNSNISEAYLSKIKKGDSIDISFPSYPEMEMRLPVARIGNIVNVENRTFKVEVQLQNEKEKLKPNVLAILKINDFSTSSALTVPSIIIKQDAEGSFLFVAREKDGIYTAEKVYVTQGISYKDFSMVNSGLDVNDKVIISGYNMLSKGVGVSIIN